jgi:hypothetical protein
MTQVVVLGVIVPPSYTCQLCTLRPQMGLRLTLTVTIDGTSAVERDAVAFEEPERSCVLLVIVSNVYSCAALGPLVLT